MNLLTIHFFLTCLIWWYDIVLVHVAWKQLTGINASEYFFVCILNLLRPANVDFPCVYIMQIYSQWHTKAYWLTTESPMLSFIPRSHGRDQHKGIVSWTRHKYYFVDNPLTIHSSESFTYNAHHLHSLRSIPTIRALWSHMAITNSKNLINPWKFVFNDGNNNSFKEEWCFILFVDKIGVSLLCCMHVFIAIKM